MIDVVLSSYSTTSVNHFNHTQLHPLQVIKRNVDSFEPGKMIPNCQLSAEFSSSAGQKVPSLKHRVKLLGAKDPFDTFLIIWIENLSHHVCRMNFEEYQI